VFFFEKQRKQGKIGEQALLFYKLYKGFVKNL